MGQNCLKDEKDARDYKIKYGNIVPLPGWIDLRSNASLPDVLNQGSINNTSSVNAVSNAIRYWLRKQNKKEYQPSRLYMDYYTKQINNKKNDVYSLRDVMKAIKKYGICSENNWPYDESKVNVKPNDDIVKEYSLNFNYYSVKNKTKYLKQALSYGYPIVFLMSVFQDQEVYNSGIVSMPKNKKIKEYIVVCMYGFRNSSNTFICMNSIGKEWGERGFFYLPFKYVEKYCCDFWTITY